MSMPLDSNNYNLLLQIVQMKKDQIRNIIDIFVESTQACGHNLATSATQTTQISKTPNLRVGEMYKAEEQVRYHASVLNLSINKKWSDL